MDPNEDIGKLKKDAPTLFGLDKSEPFQAPEGFFDHFPHQLQEIVRDVRPGVSIPFWKGLLIATPLVLVIIAVSGILITMTNGSMNRQQQFVVVDIEDVLTYDDTEDLLAVLETDDLPYGIAEEIEISSEIYNTSVEEVLYLMDEEL
jgi:hypothetical protein